MKKINVRDIKTSPVELIGDDWALLTAGTPDKFNTMTVSWGALGEMWGRDAAFVFVRPQRYTFEFIEQSDIFTLSFYGSEYKDALRLCGAKERQGYRQARSSGADPR